MNRKIAHQWLEKWDYVASLQNLHFSGVSGSPTHAYRSELDELLDPEGDICAQAVFDVDGVPTVCFLEDDGRLASSPEALDRIRQKIWNQNLVSIVLVVKETEAYAVPVNVRGAVERPVKFKDAKNDGFYSRADIQSGEIFRRHREWFSPEAHVDRDLLKNLSRVVNDLVVKSSLKKQDAQYLMAQVLFVSYLEHRKIVANTYRSKHELGKLHDLVKEKNRQGIIKLLSQLKADFNGDFLEPQNQGNSFWETLPSYALKRIDDFLSRADLETGQRSFWNYDFRYIPVELISGIYESFLSDEKRDIGAYYTPRCLANLVVDHAFLNSENILSERIYDGACGSGILLTTAYRRLLAYAESLNGDLLSFQERCQLLEDHIFGSDLSESACRVTAFSLYLSVLERLQPSDIEELRGNSDVKLPDLSKCNLKGGEEAGDFFSDKNSLATSETFTVFLSNPPWVEPGEKQILSSGRCQGRCRIFKQL